MVAGSAKAVCIVCIPLAVTVVKCNNCAHFHELVDGPLAIANEVIGIFEIIFLDHLLVEEHDVNIGNDIIGNGIELLAVNGKVFVRLLVPPFVIEVDGRDGVKVFKKTVSDHNSSMLNAVGKSELIEIIAGHCHLLKVRVNSADAVVAVIVSKNVVDIDTEVLLDFQLTVEYCNLHSLTGVFLGEEVCDVVARIIGIENIEVLFVVFLFDTCIAVINRSIGFARRVSGFSVIFVAAACCERDEHCSEQKHG